MTTPHGVTCTFCGASTPLPDDLRVPAFACAFCKATLRTADYAGSAAVSADGLIGYLQESFANPETAIERAQHAPRFEGGDTNTRPAPCLRCGETLAVPLDLQVSTVTCPGCKSPQPVSGYISDRERFELDMARQAAGNQAYKRLLAEGVRCGRCGGTNPVPDDGSVQLVCSFCGAAVLLAEHVDPSAIARHRLKHGVFALRDEALRMNAAHTQRTNRVVGVVVALLVAGFVVAGLLLGR